MTGLMIVPFFAVLASLVACEGDAGARGASNRASDPEGPGQPWAPANPWAQGSGPIAEYFHAPSGPDGAARRRQAVEELAADPGYRPERLSALLHGAELFRHPGEGSATTRGERKKRKRRGLRQIIVPVGHEHGRRVYVRLPRGYNPERPWPLIVAYHGGGGDGPPMIGQVERMLGGEVEKYVVAAPSHYRQTSLDHPPPVSSEHLAVLHALKGMAHVDSDRVYVTGYSLGAYTTWHLGTLHADRFAAAVPMAGTFGFLGGPEGVWTEFFANLRHLPVLSVWGGRDGLNVPDLNARGSAGSMSDVNRRLARLFDEHDVSTVTHHQIPRAGHGGARPPRGLLLEHLHRERRRAPQRVEHWFRYIHQGHAYWIEGHRWQGPLWDEKWPAGPPGRGGGSGEDPAWTAIRDRLGRIRGTLSTSSEHQRIEVETRHLADLTVWLEDGMIDWERPVTVVHDGREVFTGRLERDLGVALAQARRTRDFDRIRWAGVRIDATAATARPVTPEDAFPPVLREVLD